MDHDSQASHSWDSRAVVVVEPSDDGHSDVYITNHGLAMLFFVFVIWTTALARSKS